MEDLQLCVHGKEGDEAYGVPCRVPRRSVTQRAFLIFGSPKPFTTPMLFTKLALSAEFSRSVFSCLSEVNIRFDPDLWPAKLPLVRFRGVFEAQAETF